MASGSPPGITGPFQPWGSPRKNWTASAPQAVASASGSSTWKWPPMRMHGAYRGVPGGSSPRGQHSLAVALSDEAAAGQADGQSHESGDDAGHDDHALVAGGGEHLGAEPGAARDQPGRSGHDVYRRTGVRVPHDQAEDERNQAEHEHDDGRGVFDRMGASVRVRDAQSLASP